LGYNYPMTNAPTPPARLVRKLPNGRFSIEIDRRVKRDDEPEARRVRLRKLLPPGTTEGAAVAAAAKMEADLLSQALAVAGVDGWAAYVQALYEDRRSWLHVAVAKARTRSKGKGRGFSLTPETLREAMLRSKGRCEVTGLRFQVKDAALARQRPFMHSVDRIKSDLGYETTNIRIVCCAVNIALNAWGETVFAEMATGYVFNKYSAFNVLRGE